MLELGKSKLETYLLDQKIELLLQEEEQEEILQEQYDEYPEGFFTSL